MHFAASLHPWYAVVRKYLYVESTKRAEEEDVQAQQEGPAVDEV